MDTARVANNSKKWIRILLKTIFFIMVYWSIARTAGSSEFWLNHSTAEKITAFFNGENNVNCETMFDTYFYVSLIIELLLAMIVYKITIWMFNKLRSQ